MIAVNDAEVFFAAHFFPSSSTKNMFWSFYGGYGVLWWSKHCARNFVILNVILWKNCMCKSFLLNNILEQWIPYLMQFSTFYRQSFVCGENSRAVTFFIEFVGELGTLRGQRVLSDRVIAILNFNFFSDIVKAFQRFQWYFSIQFAMYFYCCFSSY